MNAKNARASADGKILTPTDLSMIGRMIVIAVFLFVAGGFGSAQKSRSFSQTGQIRAIVSETETTVSTWENSLADAGFKFAGVAGSKVEFYFVYSVFENRALTEKWIALPADEAWSRLSNQTVRLSGRRQGNKLLNAETSAVLEARPENYLTDPPPTVGLYKVAAVPLTLRPPAPALNVKSGKDGGAALSVTAEQIRSHLFNAPNSTDKFYREASYGMLGFTGVNHPQADVVPVTIQAAISNDCQDQIINQFTPIVRQRLSEQNIDTAKGALDLGIIIFNDTPGCPPYPFATRGALGQRGAPLWVWMPESWFVAGPAILTHEIGHALGGNHPLAVRCANFDDPQTCTVADAADRDFMTSGGRFNMMPNNYERRRWGWHPPGVFDNASTGLVTEPFNLHSPILSFVKDGAKQGRFYYRPLSGVHAGYDIYPEARRNYGQFERYQEADEKFRKGIAVRIGHSNYGAPEAASALLDPNDTNGLEDAPLMENQQISIGGVTVKCTREHNPARGTGMRVQ